LIEHMLQHKGMFRDVMEGSLLGTSTKGTMDPEGSAPNSCNSWPLYTHWADQRACFG